MKFKILLQKLFKMSQLTFYALVVNCIVLSNLFGSDIKAQTFKSVKEVTITVNFQQAGLLDVFGAIENLTDFNFAYKIEDLNRNVRINRRFNEAAVADILTELSKSSGLKFKQINETIHVVKMASSRNESRIEIIIQTRNVSGKVISQEDNEPLPGVNVIEKGTTNGTVTDIEGIFSLNLSQGATLVFSSVGYVPEEVEVGNRSVIDIVLVPDIKQLQELVVIGYGEQKKETITGSIASIGNKQLLQSPQANISNALVGRMPGLLSVQRSGQPGADQSTLRIRGIGTFTGSSDPLIIVDGIETDNYNNIDPNEIENISILKDASATAVYGVRGANGVLIITTKRGKPGKPQISYSAQHATSRFTNIRHSMNAADYATYYNEALKYDGYITGGYSPRFTDEEIAKYRSQEDPIFYPDVDWFDYMFNKSSGQNQHNLNINGGTEKVRYFASLGYFDQEGLINHLDIIKDYDAQLKFKRYNLRTNFDFDITKRLKASINLSSQIENRSGTGADINRVFDATWATNPLDYPLIQDDKYIRPTSFVSNGVHPLQYLFGGGYRKNYRNYLNTSTRFDYDLDFITKGLKARATVSYQNYNMQNINYGKELVYYIPRRLDDESVIFVPQNNPTPFSFNESFDKNRKVYLEAGIDYANNFGDHAVGGLLLYNQSKRHDPNFLYMIPNAYQGIVGRATYNYKSKYMAEVNIGYNGTENFAPGRRFGFFPAYSLGWVATEEPFFPKNNIVTYLKIRGSYGIVGNDKLGSIRTDDNGRRFMYMQSAYSYINNYYYFGVDGSNLTPYQGSLEGPLGNPFVVWERAKKMNIGAELEVFGDKLKFTFDYFNEFRDNILANRQVVPVIFAAELPAINLGEMKNFGWEGDITYNNRMGNFNYWIKANYTFTDNVIEFMDEIERLYPYQYRTGMRHGQHFGLIADGFFNSWEEVNEANRPVYALQPGNKIQPGDLKYIDVNGDGMINNDDAVPIGYSAFPGKIFGLSFGGDYKGIDFSVLFQGAGNVTINYHRNFTQAFLEGRNTANYFVESWSQERLDQGLPIKFPHFNQGYNANPNNSAPASNFWTRDASYIRLKNAEIGYTFPQSLLGKIGLNTLRVYANGNNLITWDNMLPGADPESTENSTAGNVNNAPYPITRTFNFGINFQF